jgi:hypothetical protein
MSEIIIEKLLTFTLIDGNWDIQLWQHSAKPVSARFTGYASRCPMELIGEVEAIPDTEKKE